MPQDWDQYTADMLTLCRYVGAELMLQGWHVSYDFYDDRCASNYKVAAVISVQEDYFTANISFYRHCYEAWQRQDYGELKGIIIHEFCHIFTYPFKIALLDEIAPGATSLVARLDERTTETLSRVMIHLGDWEIFKTIFEKGVKDEAANSQD